jgi:hypothetical protein
MANYLPRTAAPLAIILLIGVITTELRAAPSLFESCAADLKTYCSQVIPGDGRILACLYAHEDKINEICDAAIANPADLLDWFFETMRYVMDQCSDDIHKHCENVTYGGGGILNCLAAKEPSLTDNCKKVLVEMKARQPQ